MFQLIEGPILPTINYYLPRTYGTQIFGSQFVTGTKKWYLPSAAVPAIGVTLYAGKKSKTIILSFNLLNCLFWV